MGHEAGGGEPPRGDGGERRGDGWMPAWAGAVRHRWEPICRDGCASAPGFSTREEATGWAVRHRQSLGHEVDIACAFDVQGDGEAEAGEPRPGCPAA
ncbi:MAG: hypothetical protein ACE147_12960 [Candidatus Methylomirabilales bacterium]